MRLAALLTSLSICLTAGAQVRVLDDLPNLKVNDFYQDNDRFVWISTDYGLCRYNGTDYVNYFHSSSDSTSLPSNKVICSRQDGDGRLWVLTEAGVSRLVRRSGSFEPVLRDRGLLGMDYSDGKIICWGSSGFVSIECANDAVSIHGTGDAGGISFATPGHGDRIWAVSGNDAAVLCYDSSFNRIGKIELSLSGRVVCVAEVGNCLWLGTENGVKIYDIQERKFLKDDPRVKSLDYLRNCRIAVIYPYDDKVCICASNEDIHVWNGSSGTVEKKLAFRRYFSYLSYTSDFSCALHTDDGQLWVGTADRGYDIYNQDEVLFSRGRTLRRITKGKYFNSMSTAPDSVIWVASRYKGLLAVDAVSADHKWYRFVNDPQLRKLGSTGLSSVFCDRNSMLWLNMEEKLAVAHVTGLNLGNVRVLDEKLNSNAVCQDSRGSVWIAADDGLYCFRNYRLVERLFYGNVVSDVTCGPDGRVYCCLLGTGIRAVSTPSNKTEAVFSEHRFTLNLNTLRFHPDGTVWFGTGSDGLYILDGENVSHLGREENLQSPDVESIVFDCNGNAWLGTSYGLSLIRKDSRRINTWGLSESLQVQQFTSRCAIATGKYVCLGGVSGLAFFSSPDFISRLSDKPVNLRISSLKSRGRVLDECLKGEFDCFDCLPKAVIAHKDRNLTIEYESVQFYHPEAVKYAYRLKGLEDEWHYVNKARSASWSYLPAGRYTFELTAINYDGFWNAEPKRMDIVVKASPFLAWYSITLYILIVLAAVYVAMRITVERQIQNKKVDFFTNISHELRTSLSLVSGPVSMLDTADEVKRKSMIELIRTNTSSLLVLIDQLLSISRMENDCLPLMVSDIDVTPYLKRMVSSFSALAEEKEISLTLICKGLEGRLLPVDADKFQKILQNLLSNAIKYTGKFGHVSVRAGLTGNDRLRVSVIDDGIGMSQKDAQHIFERYRRLKAGEMMSKGSGIGLHYVKQLVMLHKGEIEAIVRDCGGMEFRFEIPVSPEVYTREERQSVSADIIDGFLNMETVEETAVQPDTEEDTSKPLVAVIEDNPQLRNFLKSILRDEFRVVTASNGNDGLDMITAEMPDVITTDVMMEGMDGYELCRTVKDNPLLSHIPVVILTSKVAEEDKLAGYKNKANAYITKPFNPELLLAVVRNLIEEVRKLRREILSPHSGDDTAVNPIMSEHDSRFLARLNAIIEENLSQPMAGTSELAEMMHISRSTFFRKMKALTGVSPNEYVIIYKLNKSLEMLKDESLNISEIAYSLGFSSPSHFSNTFKARFGESPRNYMNKR